MAEVCAVKKEVAKIDGTPPLVVVLPPYEIIEPTVAVVATRVVATIPTALTLPTVAVARIGRRRCW